MVDQLISERCRRCGRRSGPDTGQPPYRCRCNTWDSRDPETGRHHRNGHLLILSDVDWRCQICRHVFDAAVDADKFACGEPCDHRVPLSRAEVP